MVDDNRPRTAPAELIKRGSAKSTQIVNNRPVLSQIDTSSETRSGSPSSPCRMTSRRTVSHMNNKGMTPRRGTVVLPTKKTLSEMRSAMRARVEAAVKVGSPKIHAEDSEIDHLSVDQVDALL